MPVGRQPLVDSTHERFSTIHAFHRGRYAPASRRPWSARDLGVWSDGRDQVRTNVPSRSGGQSNRRQRRVEHASKPACPDEERPDITPTPPRPDRETFEIRVHGAVVVRLVDVPRRTAQSISAALGPLTTESTRPPDITVEFRGLPMPADATVLGAGNAAFDTSQYLVLDPVRSQPIASLPFDQVGASLSMTCSPEATSVPFLPELVNHAFMAKGYLPLHASAVSFDGHGLVFMGWPHGGKTGASLAFVNRGATFVGDEWLILSPDGSELLAFSWPMSISDRQSRQVDVLDGIRPRRGATIIRATGYVKSLIRFVRATRLGDSSPIAAAERFLQRLPSRVSIEVDPRSAFPHRIEPPTVNPTHHVLILNHTHETTAFSSCSPASLAKRMVQANRYEQRTFYAAYQAFCFAFPGRRSPLLDAALTESNGTALERALGTAECIELTHPYGAPIDGIYQALEPLVHP